MDHQREKLGNVGIQWSRFSLGFSKYRRKTSSVKIVLSHYFLVGFGKYDKKEREYEDEIYIRELSIMDGGIGCALWDASIILTRFFHGHVDFFRDMNVLELGSGCGLPSICVARSAKKVYLTEYIANLLDNLNYNVFLNTNYDEDDEKDETLVNKIRMKKRVKSACLVRHLDWYDIKEKQEKMKKALDNCQFDLVFGSELTYTLNKKTVDCLVETIELFMAPNGIFLEILSTDRDGVSFFVDRIRDTFDWKSFVVKEEYKKKLKDITKQRSEEYKFYVLKRKSEKGNKLFDEICEILEKEQPKIEERKEEEEEDNKEIDEKKKKDGEKTDQTSV